MYLSIHQLAIEEVRSRLDTLSAGRPFFARDGYSIQMDVDRPLLGDVLSLMRVPARLSENRIVLVTRGRARFTLDMETFDVQAPCFAHPKCQRRLSLPRHRVQGTFRPGRPAESSCPGIGCRREKHRGADPAHLALLRCKAFPLYRGEPAAGSPFRAVRRPFGKGAAKGRQGGRSGNLPGMPMRSASASTTSAKRFTLWAGTTRSITYGRPSYRKPNTCSAIPTVAPPPLPPS